MQWESVDTAVEDMKQQVMEKGVKVQQESLRAQKYAQVYRDCVYTFIDVRNLFCGIYL